VLGFFFEPEVRDRILKSFHTALNPNGCLVLGKREILTVPDALFVPLDRERMIFARN
jgi:two-component system CheB/CheR fusion protein